MNLNEDLSDVHKLNYLMSLLEGNAYRAVAGLEITANNYRHATEILRTRFANKQNIISTHIFFFLFFFLVGYVEEKPW